MSELIDREALRAAHGLGADCRDCKRDMKSCQYDRDYSLMDFCEWLDDAPAASPWHRVEEPPEESGKQYVVWASKGYAYCDKWLGDRWLISSVAPETVTHWMPIEPPKEES